MIGSFVGEPISLQERGLPAILRRASTVANRPKAVPQLTKMLATKQPFATCGKLEIRREYKQQLNFLTTTNRAHTLLNNQI
jgi:hypothetical protein